MIIHSIVPPDIIFRSDTLDSHSEIIDYGQIKLEVKNMGNKNYQVVRIISTNPKDYLKAEIQPGATLKLYYNPEDN